jgi:hypothetical protein
MSNIQKASEFERGVVPVAWREPFSLAAPYVGRRPYGETIAEIVASVPSLPPGFAEHGVVCVNGDVVPREMWWHVRPKPNRMDRPVAVTLHWPLQGGGAGGGRGTAKSVIGIVSMIALGFLTAGISNGLLASGGLFGGPLALTGPFAAGHFGAVALAGATAPTGAMMMGRLSE